MGISTISNGILKVGTAFPDPPFELTNRGKSVGFDIEWMQAVAAVLGLQWQAVPYEGTDFNGVFEGLSDKSFDCIASGTTITPERSLVATFCDPYVVSGQSLVCNIEATPGLRSIEDLRGLVLAVQSGNTSEPVALKLKADGRVADVRVYTYHDIVIMLDDLEAGTIGAIMKLAPVMHWFVRRRPKLQVVQQHITVERLAVSVAHGNNELSAAINDAQTQLKANDTLRNLSRKWLGT